MTNSANLRHEHDNGRPCSYGEQCAVWIRGQQTGDKNMTTLATIYYTADVFTPDDTDTNVYGEACEQGYGEAMESGWYDEAWDAWGVFETRDEVRPDTIESDDDRFNDEFTLDDLIEQDITARLGALDSFDGATAYAADSQQNYQTGVRVMVAAHVEVHTEAAPSYEAYAESIKGMDWSRRT